MSMRLEDDDFSSFARWYVVGEEKEESGKRESDT